MKIDGKQIADEILKGLKVRIGKLKKTKITPRLAIILVGNDPASTAYVRQKELKAKSIGIKTITLHLPDKTSQINLLKTIQQFNNGSNIHGIIVQQPLPPQIDVQKITQAIDPKKDVDGFHLDSHFQMPISMAILKILETVYMSIPEIQVRFVDWLKDKKIVIIGKGETGGKPIISALQKLGVKPEIIDSKTQSPEKITKTADILISAVGKPNTVKPDMVKGDAILIGVGTSRGRSAKLVGDYDQNKVKDIASFYTPTPGGIGPINVAYLLKNLVEASEKSS